MYNSIHSKILDRIAGLPDVIDAVSRFLDSSEKKCATSFRDDFLVRLTGFKTSIKGNTDVSCLKSLGNQAAEAVLNMEKFAIVSLAEYWSLSLSLISEVLDNKGRWNFWDNFENIKSNEGETTFSTSDIVSALPNSLRQRIEKYTVFELFLFRRARGIFFEQCQEILSGRNIKTEAECHEILNENNDYRAIERAYVSSPLLSADDAIRLIELTVQTLAENSG